MGNKSKYSGYVNGIFFNNGRECAKYFSIPFKRFVEKLKSGLTLQEVYDLSKSKKIKTAKKVVIFDVEFDCIEHALRAFLFSFGGNQTKKANRLGISISESIEMSILERQRIEKQKYYGKPKPALYPQKPKWIDDVLGGKLIVGEYSELINCLHCKKLCGRHKQYSQYCSELCSEMRRQESAIKHRKDYKKRERSAGLDSRGKHKKRHKKYGGVYDKSITSKLVAIKYGMICQICKCRVEKHFGGFQKNGWTIGHIKPVSLGGDTVWENVQLECHECNSYKRDFYGTNEEAMEFILKEKERGKRKKIAA